MCFRVSRFKGLSSGVSGVQGLQGFQVQGFRGSGVSGGCRG